jgi:hypothetical protein
MKRRWRIKHAKPGELRVYYGKPDNWNGADVCYAFGGNGAQGADSRVLAYAFENVHVFDGKPLRKLLEERGYDITTIKFSIQRATLPDALRSRGESK